VNALPQPELPPAVSAYTGLPDDPVGPPGAVPPADLIICESAYGGRTHEPAERRAERMAEVVRRTEARGGKGRVIVEDTGPGIPKEHHARLFDVRRHRRGTRACAFPTDIDDVRTSCRECQAGIDRSRHVHAAYVVTEAVRGDVEDSYDARTIQAESSPLRRFAWRRHQGA